VRYLLDTHAFIWWLADDPRLGRKARAAIAAKRSSVLVSAASTWEMAIKASLGKLRMRRVDLVALSELSTRCGFSDLPVTSSHAALVRNLALHHHDHFDRMLVVQAMAESLVLVTADEQFKAYAVRRLDADQ
jgi:PIN domain nuclease of toxin-antitoxin system